MTETFQIGSSVYTVTPLPAMRAFALQPRIAPAVAEIFATLGADGGAITEQSVEMLAPLVGRFFAKLPAGELEAITRELLSTATADGMVLFTGNGDPFDVKMQGKILEVWQLLWHAVRVNYPDFFGRLAGFAAARPVESASAA